MKIMILANNDVGLYQFRKELIEELLKENSVVVVLPEGELIRLLCEMGCRFIDTPIDRRGMNPITDIRLFFQYRKILRQEKPDLVLTYTIKPNVYGGAVCRILHIPYGVNITGLGTAFEKDGMLRKAVAILHKVSCKKAKVVFFENEENKRLFVREKIVKEEQAYRLNGAGVNLEKYQVAEYPKGENVRFLFLGRVMAEKGIDELFTAMRRLVSHGVDVQLEAAGPCEEDYDARIKQYEAEGWLHYHGYQKDVRPFLESAHCLVLPSWHEGMANTNLESAASGRPVITSNIPGCREAVEDGISGYLMERKNAEDLYRAMKKFAGLSYEKRKAMGLAGRKRMEEMFDKTKVVEETIERIFR